MPNRVPAALRRTVLVTVLVLAASLAGGVAHAGGPTSALLVASETGRAAALHTTDARYEQLDALLSAEPGTAAVPPVEGAGAITVTWLVHDVAVWRIHRIDTQLADGPWVLREQVDPDTGGIGGPGAAVGSWYRPADPAALRALLDELQLTGGPRQHAAGAAVPVPAAAPAPAPVPFRAAGGPWWTGWWWAPVGLLLGGAATALVLRRSRDTGGRVGQDGDHGWPRGARGVPPAPRA